MLKWLAIAVAAMAVYGAGVAVYLVLAGLNDDVRPVDAIVVLGNHVHEDGTMSDRLQARVDRALALYRDGVAPYIIISGGVSYTGASEVAAMRHHLLAAGVPAEAIIADSGGVNTAATAAFTAGWLAERGGGSVLVVTQYFHIVRSRLAMARQGITDVAHAHGPYVGIRDIVSIPREVLALHALWLGIERDMPI